MSRATGWRFQADVANQQQARERAERPGGRCVLVCGGRNYADIIKVRDVLDTMHAETPITRIVQGGAMGADAAARSWAHMRGVDVETFPADWDAHGKAAGPIRNGEMLLHGQPAVVVAFPGGAGTADMVRQAREARIGVVLVGQ